MYYSLVFSVVRGWVNLPQNACDWEEIPKTQVPNALLCSRLAINLKTEGEQKVLFSSKCSLPTFSYIFAMFYHLNITIAYKVYAFSTSDRVH